MAWCVDKAFPEQTRYTVTANKAPLFLAERVVDRERKTKRKNDKGPQKIGISTLKQYTSALTDFYNEQVAMNINNNAPPRNHTVKLLLKNYETAKRKEKISTIEAWALY